MPTSTYVPLANITLSGSASSVTFSTIPQNYKDLILVCSLRQASSNEKQSTLRPNGDSANGTLIYLDGYGSTTGTGASSALSLNYAGSLASNLPIASTTQIFDYSHSDKQKGIYTRAGSISGAVSSYGCLWASTSAITSLVIVPTTGGNFSAGTTLALYGIDG